MGELPNRRGPGGITSKLPSTDQLRTELADAKKRLQEVTDYLESEVKEAGKANEAYEKLSAVRKALD